MSFLPSEYEIPVDQKYFKLQQGENRFRIIGNPVIGWLDWKDRKPLRFRMDDRPDRPVDANQPIRHFWAFVVWNPTLQCLQIMEVHQKSIQASLKSLFDDKDWGEPSGYDIKIIKEGEGRETEYTVQPVPHKPIAPEVQQLFDNAKINLEKLFTGDDPFMSDAI